MSDLVDDRVGPGLDAEVDAFMSRRMRWIVGAWRGAWVELHEHR
ncbi:MAG: hypothetical protein ABSF89_04810 [Acidimicrobiales bacterium]